jgi:N-acetyl-anhydromuramyl-L-alanine amidase AmpD
VESNERYYRRRAVEERMAAQRAVTETARAWHSQLAESFAERAIACTSTSIGIGIGIAASSAAVAVSG